MAVANDPELIIADEPTTALDVTIQAQILDVLDALRRRTNTAMVIITHDLGVVAGIADRVNVMYAGKVVERGEVDDIFHANEHPYTAGLLRCLPRLDRRSADLKPIGGAPPVLDRLPPGCSFAPRCSAATAACTESEPSLRHVGATAVACHLAPGALAKQSEVVA
jgi:oligopeptide/dipeptide ABC transporter ATP-binding protein